MPSSDGVTKIFTPEETASWLQSLDKRFASAAVWCEAPDGQLIIVKSPYKKFWSLPGGIIDAEETPREAAVREVQEEIGITLDQDDLEFRLVHNRINDGLGYNYQFIFQAAVSQPQLDAITLQPSEIDAWKLVSRDDVVAAASQRDDLFGASIYDWAHERTGYSEIDFRPRRG